jgi:cobalt/nickel transport system ATP-binding protein
MKVGKRTLAVVRQKIGLVFQDSDNQLFMPTVLEDVAFGPLNLGLDRKRAMHRAVTALDLVGMSAAAQRAPYHLSAGEKKRVAIAGILAMEPEILILDEPTTFLDPPGRRALADLLARLPQAKILVTHDIEFAAGLADRAVFFESGTVAGEGSVSEIIRRFAWAHIQCVPTSPSSPRSFDAQPSAASAPPRSAAVQRHSSSSSSGASPALHPKRLPGGSVSH